MRRKEKTHPITRLLAIVAAIVLFFVLNWAVRAAPAPQVTLAERYDGQSDLADYWVSEKFDGVRGYWTGEALITRGGTPIDPPAWFTAGWPDTPMDGELWIDYGEFARVSGIVRTHDASDRQWRQISYRVFDLPEHGGEFDARVPAIRKTVAAIDQPWVVAIRQFKVDDPEALDTALARVLARGGEGLILHRGDAPYRAGRSDDVLKLKPYEDAEARVIGINPGQGRLEGLMGSLDVRTPDGREFAIGSGFTDAERADPPPLGSWITYRYNGETATGLPRFARFLRRRPGGPPPEPSTGR
ncbi:DNA ligase ATP-dependent protein [Salinisphaera shabanensis E1L3A]|jgi:DNA ligase-1|uniref:DNA ligase ATP-dependent protein n=1 Tax=Salinisphaera shabanensis E1L3A TaxID=1033802 RepID=U2G1Q5_9GAMM|nr:DNA ligase [Salinisphaera shabanensis]ERJ20148.1 DNA ligase ATP-dependent protein [Salinisphaera shabanensis E1L3A]